MAIALDDERLRDVWSEVMDEYERVEATGRGERWPSGDPVRGVALITEEVGEAMKEALDVTRGYSAVGMRRLRAELVQTAATTIRMLMDLSKTEGRQQ